MPRNPQKPREDFSRLDWRRSGVRVTSRTDATTRERWRHYMTLLDRLWDDERQYDVVHAIKANAVSLAEVDAEIKRTGDFGVANLMARVLLARPLLPMLQAAAKTLARSAASKQRNHYTLQKLVRHGVVRPGMAVRDLLTVKWAIVRAGWTTKRGALASASDWNHVRRFLSSALTQFFGGGRTGEAHPFRLQVLDRFTGETEYEREVTLTVEEFERLVAALPEHYRAPFVTLAVTGIRVGEYLALSRDKLQPAVPAIRVRGKTGPGVVNVEPSMWPFVDMAVPAPVRSRSSLRRALKDAATTIGHPELRIHDLRHFAAHAMVAGAASIAAVRDQLRHADAKTTMRYLKGANRAEAARAIAQSLGGLRVVGGHR